MSDTTNNKQDQKQKLKKYAVFAAMSLVFVLSMWLIFAPSDADKQKQQQGVGFNADIPEPKKDEIIGDKRDAYVQEQMQQKQKDRMHSLDAFSLSTDGDGNQDTPEQVAVESPPQESQKRFASNSNPIRNSSSAYQDINRTLGNFYEAPKEDPEKKELKKKLEELEARLDEKENKQSTIDEQLLLMEKSYQMAAKYMPQTENTQPAYNDNGQGLSAEQMKNKIVKTASSDKKTKASPVRQIRESAVSSLAQRLSDEDLMNQYDRERNFGFYQTGDKPEVSNRNTIAACIHDEQTLTEGQSCRMRLTEPFMAGSTFIPENTIITGNVKIQGERLEIMVSSIEYEGEIIAVELLVYDSDGQRGINIPGSMEMNAIKEVAANAGSNLGSTINISQQSAAQQLLTDMGRGVMQGTSQYLAKKLRTVKVTLKPGYRVMLLPKDN